MWNQRSFGEPDPVELAQYACAMEIVALALRLELDVWGLLKTDVGRKPVDTTQYARGQLGAGILLTCGALEVVWPAYATMLSDGQSAIGDGLARDYKASKQRLEAMFTKASLSLVEYQIPLSIEVDYIPNGVSLGQIANMFDAMVATGNVQTAVPPDSQSGQQPKYRLVDVSIKSCTVVVHDEETDLLNTLGVYVSSLDHAEHMGHATVKELLTTPSSGPLVAATIQLQNPDKLVCLHALLSYGQRLGSLRVSLVDCVELDLEGLVRVLLHTKSKWAAALHDLTIELWTTLDAKGVKVMEDAIAKVLDGPRRFVRIHKTIDETMVEGALFPLMKTANDEVFVLLPDGETASLNSEDVEPADHTTAQETTEHETTPSIESFSCAVQVSDAHVALRVARLIQRFLPSTLKTLVLDISCLDDACLKLPLKAFPQLETLRLKSHQLTTVEPLVNVFSKPSCKIQALELSGSDVSVIELLTVFADPTSRIRQLQVRLSHDQEAHEPFFVAVETMLRANDRLEVLKISKAGYFSRKVDERLCGFRCRALPSQSKLALISVVRAASRQPDMSSALSRLDCESVNAIMALAEAPCCRRVCVEK